MNLTERQQTGLAQFVRLSNRLGARPDYVQGSGGSTSVKLDGGIMAVKASGFQLKNIEDDQGYALMDYAPVRDFFCQNKSADLFAAEQSGAEKLLSHCRPDAGGERPQLSLESGFHALLGRFVLHSHSVYARLIACVDGAADFCTNLFAGEAFLFLLMPAIKSGSRLAFAICEALAGYGQKNVQRPFVILLQEHGLVVSAESEESCWLLHERVNRLCAAALKLDVESYPQIRLERFASGDKQRNCYRSSTPWLQERLAEKRYGFNFLRELEPDYAPELFMDEALTRLGNESPEGRILLRKKGGLEYHMGHARALSIEEMLVAHIYIAEHRGADGLRPSGRCLWEMSAD